MSSLSEQSLQLRLDRRSGTLSEVDRAHFEKQQVECIQKAIKNEECPAKEKHVRRCIIGTWQERGNSFFWSVLGRQPLPSQVFMCWKSLTVMHRVFREGHPNVLRDSYVYRKTLRDLFSVYRFQAGTYGTLVCQYLKILQSKLELHKKYPGIIGSLSFSEENPIKIPDKDINDVFTFAVESFDYQDSLLALEEAVFKTLDKGRNNSQILASQCRIAALIPLLKECSGMYDVLVFVMVKLHKNLPPDTLDGHRQRFYEQHKKLKMFCMEASNLQYVTNLTPIPDIPDQPPDFLIHRYEPKQERPRDEPKPVQITPKIDERDVLIEQLMREIDELRMQLDETKRKAQDMENNLRMQIVRLQQELKSLQTVAKQACDENVFLKKQMEEQVKDDTDAQEKAKSADEKFNKLKAVYAKLRQDHILLLKKQSEVKQKEENSDKLAEETQEQLRRLQNAADEKTRELHMAKANMDELEKVNQALKIEFDQSDQSNKDRIASLSKEIAQLTKALHDTEIKAKIAANELEATRNLSEGQLKALQEQLQHLSTGKITEETARKSAEDAISKLKEGNAMAEARLSAELAEARAALVAEEKSRRAAEEANLKLSEQLKSECARLLSDIARLSKDREIELDSKMRTQAELEKLQQHSSGEISTLSSELLGLRREREMLLHDKEQLVRDLQSRQAQLDRETAELRARLGQSQSEFVEQSASRKLAEEQLRKATHEFESKLALMTSSLSEAQSSKTREESAKKQAEELAVKARLDYEAQLVVSKKQKEEEDLRAKYELLASAARNCEEIIEQTLALFNDSKHESGTTCTAEYLKSTLGSLCERVDGVSRLFSAFHSTHDGILPLVGQLSATTHMISDALIHGKATSHMGSVDESKNLVHHCRRVGDSTLKYLSGFKSRNTDPAVVQQDDGKLKLAISELMKLTEELIPKQADSVEGVDNIVGEEMQATEKLVNDAAARIEEMLNKSRKHHSGVQLEVNERILDSCTGLMKAIRELILKSKDLQDEIVAEGRGSASARDFYKRHHKWTEGLLSAAKSVGMGATLLVKAADKVVERKGKFEELIVVSHEISASTAQLVAASRVKASKNSQKLPPLMAASKGVGNATAEVVAAVRTGAEMTDIAATVPDYSKLTLTQAKRFEMDAQVKILELEDNLSKERSRLGQLRKAHYQLAVELYGEEQVNMPELNASQPSRFQR